MLETKAQPGCCGAYLIYGFSLGYSYVDGSISSSKEDIKNKQKIAKEDLKRLMNLYKGKAFIFAFLNVPQQKVYEKLLLSLGWKENASGENVNHPMTSPLKMYIWTQHEAGKFDENRGEIKELNKKGKCSLKVYPQNPLPFPEETASPRVVW